MAKFPYLRRRYESYFCWIKNKADVSSKLEHGVGGRGVCVNTEISNDNNMFWIILGSIAFYISAYLFFMICCTVFLTFYDPKSGVWPSWLIKTHINGLIESTTQNIGNISQLNYAPSENMWKTSLAALEYVEIKLASGTDRYSLRLKIVDSVYDSYKGLTTLRLALGQTLLIAPKLTAFLDENGKLVAVTSSDREAGVMMPIKKNANVSGKDIVIEEVAEMLSAIVNRGDGIATNSVSSSSINSINSIDNDIKPDIYEHQKDSIAFNYSNSTKADTRGDSGHPSGTRRLGMDALSNRLLLLLRNRGNNPRRLGVYKKHDKKYQTATKPNAHKQGYRPAPYPYPYPYPSISQAPLYQRPFQHIPQPPLQQFVQLVSQPQQVYAVPNLQPFQLQPIPSVLPEPSPILLDDDMTPGDIEVLSELIKSSNKELTEQILDLTIKREDVVEKQNNVIDGDTLITVDAQNKLTSAISSNQPQEPNEPREEILDLSYNPRNNVNNNRADINSYVNGFTDGYRDGFDNGVETGEDITTSLWCSIDSSHPLCDELPKGKGTRPETDTINTIES